MSQKKHTPRLDLPGIPDVRFHYVRRDKPEHHRLREVFDHHVREAFRRHLAADCREELIAGGLTEPQISRLADGLSVEGYNVHHKHPLDDSGTNDFSNLVLMDLDSHKELHLRVDPQIGRLERGQQATIRMPVPAGSVYVHPSKIRQPDRSRRQDGPEEEIGNLHRKEFVR